MLKKLLAALIVAALVICPVFAAMCESEPEPTEKPAEEKPTDETEPSEETEPSGETEPPDGTEPPIEGEGAEEELPGEMLLMSVQGVDVSVSVSSLSWDIQRVANQVAHWNTATREYVIDEAETTYSFVLSGDATQTFMLTNKSDVPASYEISPPSAFSVSNRFGTLAAGASQTISVTLNISAIQSLAVSDGESELSLGSLTVNFSAAE